MIIYTANDIIRRAEQLADLENSSYISEYEKTALLNESYSYIYQKMIEANDKSFIRTAAGYDGMRLPADLYQIATVYTDNRNIVPKINESQHSGYDIRNGRLTLSSDYDTVYIDYWPVPMTATVKEKEQDNPFPDSILAANSTLYYDKDYYLKSLDNTDMNVYVKADISADIKKWSLYRNALLGITDTQYYIYDIYNMTSKKIDRTSSSVIVRDCTLFILDGTSMKDLMGNIYSTVAPTRKEEDKTVYPEIMFVSSDFSLMYEIYSDGKVYVNGNEVECSAMKPKMVLDHQGLKGITESGELICVKEDGLVLSHSESQAYMIVSDRNMIAKRSLTYHIEGIQFETVFDFPTHTAYQLLSYRLAIQFRMKQQADIKGLQLMYEDILSQFSSSVKGDINSYRIKNMDYKRGY